MRREVLEEFFQFLYNHRIHTRNMSCVDALARMYLAMNDWVCVSAVEDHMNRRKITHKIDLLYRIIERNSVSNLKRMYRLVKEAPMAVYGEKDEECSELYGKLLGNYVKHPDPKEELDAMQCIVYELADIPGDNTQFDYYPYFRMKCNQWITDLDDAGYWKNVSDETALQRMKLLQDNSCVFGDKRFDETLLHVYCYYRERLVLPINITVGHMPLLGAWYDLLRISGLFPYERTLQRKIVRLMENYADKATFGSDTWYQAIGYAFVSCCTDLIDDMRRKAIQAVG